MTTEAAVPVRFADMSFRERLAFFAKLFIFIVTFGFALPTLLSE